MEVLNCYTNLLIKLIWYIIYDLNDDKMIKETMNTWLHFSSWVTKSNELIWFVSIKVFMSIMSSINIHCEYISSLILKIIQFHLLLIQKWQSSDDVVLFRNFNQIYIYENVCCGLSLLTLVMKSLWYWRFDICFLFGCFLLPNLHIIVFGNWEITNRWFKRICSVDIICGIMLMTAKITSSTTVFLKNKRLISRL